MNQLISAYYHRTTRHLQDNQPELREESNSAQTALNVCGSAPLGDVKVVKDIPVPHLLCWTFFQTLKPLESLPC